MAYVELKSVAGLSGKKFSVPLYQRGYRWEAQQVKDLLEDIAAFMVSEDKSTLASVAKSALAHDDAGDSFYCLQPLAVKKLVKDEKSFLEALPKSDAGDVRGRTREAIDDNIGWEVIDGQQRLTTVWLILNFLGKTNPYVVEFARRKDKKQLADIIDSLFNESTKDDTIDEHYIRCAKAAIAEFFAEEKESDDYKTYFYETLLNKVQFIWYEVDEEDPIKVFTRLNIGKIALTNSELIKALFLNRSNFAGDGFETVRLRQMEISGRWDGIEATLQDAEFWMFLHEPEYDKPTRIDFIFDLICDMKLLGSPKTDIGNDKYRTFRYFSEYFHSESKPADIIKQCWQEVDSIFAAFKEWFGDLTLYHYVGFLVACWEKKRKPYLMKDVLVEWRKASSKKAFVKCLRDKIKGEIGDYSCDLDAQYEISGHPKTQCLPLLLLHNIQTVIDQNSRSAQGGELKDAFYRFPFHLYKTEGWDVEHVDSSSENELVDKDSQNEFLLNRYLALPEDLRKDIAMFIGDTTAGKDKFETIKKETAKVLGEELDPLGQDDKNKLWNFALLDSSTNRGYGNAIFSAKRRIIIGKDSGMPLQIPRIAKKNGDPVLELPEPKGERAESVFIPPCTRQVFFKYYSATLSSPNYWTKTDAEAYRQNIFEALKDFGVKLKEEEKNDE